MFAKQRLNDAVSPVVGVILMVAVTVILAAVIGSFVLDLGSNVEQNPSAGVTFDGDGSDVTVQVISMENADGLYVQNSAGDYYDDDADSFVSDKSSIGDDGYSLASTGDSVTVTSDSYTVIGELNGKSSVIQTYEP